MSKKTVMYNLKDAEELVLILAKTEELLMLSRGETLQAKIALKNLESSSPKASDIDPYLPDLYWKWCSGIYAELDASAILDKRDIAHEQAMMMTKRFREEMLDGKRHDDETPRDELQD